VYTPLRNDFVPLSLINLVYSYTCKVPHRPLHPPKNEKVPLAPWMVMDFNLDALDLLTVLENEKKQRTKKKKTLPPEIFS
jgi:hypothetical protein